MDRIVRRVLPVLFLSIMIFFVIRTYFQRKALLSNFSITSGTIVELGNSRNGGQRVFFMYKFFVNGVAYDNSASIACSRANKETVFDLLSGKRMVVIYKKNDPDNCEMIIERESFKKYNLPIADDYKPILDSLEHICSKDN